MLKLITQMLTFSQFDFRLNFDIELFTTHVIQNPFNWHIKKVITSVQRWIHVCFKVL
jgi:hypothetical protein